VAEVCRFTLAGQVSVHLRLPLVQVGSSVDLL